MEARAIEDDEEISPLREIVGDEALVDFGQRFEIGDARVLVDLMDLSYSQGQNSTTGQMSLMKRASDVPPPVVRAGTRPVTDLTASLSVETSGPGFVRNTSAGA